MTLIDSLQSIVQPIIVDLLLMLVLAIIGWAASFLPARFRLDIEARHRDALHKALDTGVGLAIDTLQKHPAIAAPDMAIGVVLDYVDGSVPDALRRLAPSRAQLEDMARAKLQQQVDAITGRDRLTEALNRVPGVSAQKP